MTPSAPTATGRYAPSPSGDLHVGNLRTALLAWLSAHHSGGELRLRIDDLDPLVSSSEVERRQRNDLARLGVTFDGPEIRQSDRFDAYHSTIEQLVTDERVYPCFCSRREIREAASAPHLHLPDGAYPGTCATLSSAERDHRALDRPAALRIRANNVEVAVHDRLYGSVTDRVDDFVVRRNDGVPAYNLATVLDDEEQAVTEVVRGADLLAGTARHVWLREVLGLRAVEHGHVPLVLNSVGDRLAKRDGAVSLDDLAALGLGPRRVLGLLAESLGLAEPGEQPTVEALLGRYDPTKLSAEDSVWDIDAKPGSS